MKAAAVIVAHPDDEIIWSGGLILSNPHWDWTILSLCRADDPDRSVKFNAICERLDLEGIISDLDDSYQPAQIDPGRHIGRRILDRLGRFAWDLCITHGANGEYGHVRHKQIHREVVSLVRKGTLRSQELWTFAYECDTAASVCRPSDNADSLMKLMVDSQLRERMGATARKRVLERFDYRVVARKFLEILQNRLGIA